ncbi:MAG: serine/threonine protein kinase [Nitrososphaera sp.]
MPRQRDSFSAFEPDAPQLARILTYPRFEEDEYRSRLDELRRLGVTSLIVGGRTMIGGVRIAGKGNVGLVIKVMADDDSGCGGNSRVCALKIRRTDANRENMEGEVRLHRMANAAKVGPVLLKHSDNFMLMEFVKGKSISDWTPDSASSARRIAGSVLEQCYRLDRTGIDHGELSHLDNHVIVGGSGNRATIIDFESASTERKMSNVSAAGQSLFVAGAVAATFSRALGIDRERAIAALKKYKWNQTRENFDALLSIL